jgi:hypothetical protein
MLARTPGFQFNPMSLIGANKGVFGVNLGRSPISPRRGAAFAELARFV